MAALASQKSRKHRTHAVQDTHEIHLDGQPILFRGNLIAGPGQAHARVVDQYVDGATLRFGRFHHPLPGRQIAHVEDCGFDARKLLTES